MNKLSNFIVIYFTATILITVAAMGQNISPADQKNETERTDAYAVQFEKYLDQYLVDKYDERASTALAFPSASASDKKVPLIIVQQGNGSTPETPFRGGAYHEYAKELLKAVLIS